jgi:hypothetical protein
MDSLQVYMPFWTAVTSSLHFHETLHSHLHKAILSMWVILVLLLEKNHGLQAVSHFDDVTVLLKQLARPWNDFIFTHIFAHAKLICSPSFRACPAHEWERSKLGSGCRSPLTWIHWINHAQPDELLEDLDLLLPNRVD